MWFGRHSKREQTPKTTRRRSPNKKRALRIEGCEPRVLLTHSAPQLNSALVATFSAIYENQSVGANGGEAIDALLTSGGNVLNNPNQLPLTSGGFAFFDETDGGKEGIAVTGLTGTADGAWEYSTNGGSSWSLFAANVSPTAALLLSGDSGNSTDNLIRFLPDNGFSGQVAIEFRAWDQSDGQAIGATVDVSAIGGDGAFSAAATVAKLSVQRDVYAVPTATLKNYVIDYTNGGAAAAANGVLSGDTDPNAAFDGGLTAQLATAPTNGTLSSGPGGDVFGPGGSFNYSPGGSFHGYDQFTYKAVSGPASSATQTVTLYSHGGALTDKMYLEMLNRAARAADVEGWAPSVDGDIANITAVDQGIYQSAEYESPQIASFYQKFLFRSPAASDTSYYENVWTSNNDQGPPPVIVDIAASDECFADEGQSDTNWVTLLYTAILGRSPDTTGLNYFVNQLDTGTSRQTVVSEFVDGGEYHGDMVQSFFTTFLNRPASQSDLTYYESLMAQGDSQLQIQQILVGSGEYTNNPPAATGGAADPWTS